MIHRWRSLLSNQELDEKVDIREVDHAVTIDIGWAKVIVGALASPENDFIRRRALQLTTVQKALQ